MHPNAGARTSQPRESSLLADTHVAEPVDSQLGDTGRH